MDDACLHERLRKTPVGLVCVACGRAVVPDAGAAAALTAAGQTAIHGLPRRGLLVWAATLPLAILVMVALPWVRVVLYTLGILCHEMGHAAVAILTGHLAVPSFDLLHGGGVTTVFGRSWLVLSAIAAVTVHTALRLRDHPLVPKACAAGAALVGLLIVTGLDEPLWIEMGHGGQLVAGGIFLYRGLTGAAEVYPGERWLYAFVGWSLVLEVVALCWNLTHDPAALATYHIGKCGADNDLVRLAYDHLGTSVQAVAWGNLVLCLLVPVAAAACCVALRRARLRPFTTRPR
jgi:hypothetical protein